MDAETNPTETATPATEPPAEPAKTEEQIAAEAFDAGAEIAPEPTPAEPKPADSEVPPEPKPDEPPAEPDPAEKQAADDKAADDKEVAELGLKGRSEARMRELSGRVRELSRQVDELGGEEMVKALVQAGGKQGIERLATAAREQAEWSQKLTDIGCTPEQYGQAMAFVAGINSKDEAVLRQTRDNLLKEIAALDGRLGEKTDRYDPLAQFPDLREKVESGAIDEADAVEIATLRVRGKQTAEQVRTAEQATSVQAEQQRGTQQLTNLGAALRQRDGEALFGAKMAAIRGALDSAVAALPPAQWAEAAQRLYDGITVQAPAALPRVGKQPMRATTPAAGAAVHRTTSTDPIDAWDLGVEQAKAAGL